LITLNVFFASQAFAIDDTDALELTQVDQNLSVSQSLCLEDYTTSSSQLGKQTQLFRGVIHPRQVEDLMSGKTRILIKDLKSKLSVHASGRGSFAEIQNVEMSIRVKSRSGKVLSTTLVKWSEEETQSLVTSMRSSFNFDYIHKGHPRCQAAGPRATSHDCQFTTSTKVIDESRLQSALTKHFHHRRNRGVIIEVIYRSTSYTDCVGNSSKSVSFGSSSDPIVVFSRR